ncbi:MAG: hypothetical protein MUO76_21630 [Anaerolineaceae bacterium]|nr:hypothetical protein [Anaerolineaceae bacterium]
MSVGHVARVFEGAGISTVIVAVKAFRSSLEVMALPRVLLTPHPMGRPLGAPGDRERQRAVILAALDLLAEAQEGGTIIELPGRYHPL